MYAGVVPMNDKVPAQIPQQDLDPAGFIISSEEQLAIIALLNASNEPKVLAKGTRFPDGSPLNGKTLTFSAIKDEHGNIMILHDKAVLGKGAFGNVVVAQVIQSSDPLIKPGDFCAVKMQALKKAKDAARIQKEDSIGKMLGLNMSSFAAGMNYYSVMPVLPGQPVSKAVASYVGKFKKDEKPNSSFDNPEDFNVPYFISLFQRLTNAVEVVHQAGIVHLDIKPDNMIENPDTGEVVLMDFGTSQLRKDQLASPAESAIGTPTFMASEFFDSEYTEQLSTKQDIYSLARTFELAMYGNMLKLNDQTYELRAPSPVLDGSPLYTSSHLKNQRIPNENQSPAIDAVNDLIELIHVMRNPNPNTRPEASEIKARLGAISAKYEMAINSAAQVAGPSNQMSDARNLVKALSDELKTMRDSKAKDQMRRITPMFNQGDELGVVRELRYEIDKVKSDLKNNRCFDAEAVYSKVESIVKKHADAAGNQAARLCYNTLNDIQNRRAPAVRSKFDVKS